MEAIQLGQPRRKLAKESPLIFEDHSASYYLSLFSVTIVSF